MVKETLSRACHGLLRRWGRETRERARETCIKLKETDTEDREETKSESDKHLCKVVLSKLDA